MNKFILLLAAAVSCLTMQAEAVPLRHDDNTPSRAVDALNHQLRNHEMEIRMLEERLANQEIIMDSLRQQNEEALISQRELLRNAMAQMESKMAVMEKENRALKETLPLYKQKIMELETAIETQNQNIAILQNAFTSHDTHVQPGSGYRVKPGDSLERIARQHNISIQALKEANNLANDRIISGQTLKIPVAR